MVTASPFETEASIIPKDTISYHALAVTGKICMYIYNLDASPQYLAFRMKAGVLAIFTKTQGLL